MDGLVSPIAAIELFAQSAAVLMSHRTGGTDPNPVAGALLGTRGVDFLVPSMRVGDVLRVVATESWGAGALAQFDVRAVPWSGQRAVRARDDQRGGRGAAAALKRWGGGWGIPLISQAAESPCCKVLWAPMARV